MEGKRDGFRGVAVSPRGRMAIAYGLRSTFLWDIQKQQVRRKIESEQVTSAAFSPDGKQVFLAGILQCFVLDMESGQTRAMPTRFFPGKYKTQYLPDGKHVVLGSGAVTHKGAIGLVLIVHVESGRTVRTYKCKPVVNAMVVSADGSQIVGGTSSGEVMVWNVQSKGPGRTVYRHKRAAQSVDISADGKWILSYGDDGVLAVYSANGSGRPTIEVGGRSSGVASAGESHGATSSFGATALKSSTSSQSAKFKAQLAIRSLASAAKFEEAIRQMEAWKKEPGALSQSDLDQLEASLIGLLAEGRQYNEAEHAGREFLERYKGSNLRLVFFVQGEMARILKLQGKDKEALQWFAKLKENLERRGEQVPLGGGKGEPYISRGETGGIGKEQGSCRSATWMSQCTEHIWAGRPLAQSA